ncbi:metalloregulator ArsR/SmtB family transcription factor [Kineococcus siccus]|uniref:metalloregulator ArsR/SmtB family transcription factor n=1 Tax=Kineococcus siccus TaxID=2696567 RepID=UPI00196A82F2
MVVRETGDGPAPGREVAVDRVFAALGDATRRDIVRRLLTQPEASVSVLAERYAMSFAAVAKHVAVLERARLVSKTRRGREQVVRAEIGTLRSAAGLLAEFETLWRTRIDRMEGLLAEEAPAPRGEEPS